MFLLHSDTGISQICGLLQVQGLPCAYFYLDAKCYLVGERKCASIRSISKRSEWKFLKNKITNAWGHYFLIQVDVRSFSDCLFAIPCLFLSGINALWNSKVPKNPWSTVAISILPRLFLCLKLVINNSYKIFALFRYSLPYPKFWKSWSKFDFQIFLTSTKFYMTPNMVLEIATAYYMLFWMLQLRCIM